MLITVDEIMKLFKISSASAYRIIADLNLSLKEKRYRTIHGKTSRKFFHENYYSNTMEVQNSVCIQR